MFDPWESAVRRGVDVVYAPLRGKYGCTDGRVVWLHPAQSRREERCALTHELVHIERGESSECSSAVELAVRAEVARRLVELDRLTDAYRWASSLDEVAGELGVTRAVLVDRLDGLGPDESAALASTVLSREPAP